MPSVEVIGIDHIYLAVHDVAVRAADLCGPVAIVARSRVGPYLLELQRGGLVSRFGWAGDDVGAREGELRGGAPRADGATASGCARAS